MRFDGTGALGSHFSENLSSKLVSVVAKASCAGRKEIEVAQRPGAAFGQRAKRQSVLHEDFNRLPGELSVAGMVGIRGEGQHDLIGNPRGAIFDRVLP